MSKILVTGGLGLIGHHVVQLLENLGHDVIITDTQTNYGIIPQDEIDYLMKERKKKIKKALIYKFDICDQRNLDWLFASHKLSNPSLITRLPIIGLALTTFCLGKLAMCMTISNLFAANNQSKFFWSQISNL